ncbi:hypothetical protein H0H81_003881 [Sphagnurus paluster]|uniref:mannan endo-1,4-beta-mannosidase n=1 Tax=Sphagnurus paluster TaxID=117069 RepID=A0A9P7KLH7_9AGAR|nr:hypothetical protein H0H81_003881 [Sphagnurus paluster]
MFIVLCGLLLAVIAASATAPTSTIETRNNVPASQFVTTQGGRFFVNGSEFKFVGTNAYWLPALNTEEDIDNTLASIRAANFTVVRTWAFNDVDSIPESGTWFQLISNGTLTINDGPNGIQKLDKVIELAQKHGIYVLLSLTNNWSPIVGIDQPLPARFTPRQNVANTTLPRNALSNSYGGMDTYIRNFGGAQEHDQFYVNQTIIDAFKNYTSYIAARYASHPNVFGWELANDPQQVAPPPPPPPRPSAAPGARPRSIPEPLTKRKLLKERKAARKREIQQEKRTGVVSKEGVRIRGRWMPSQTKRQVDQGSSPAYDGAYGVDSEDIINIPEIGFGSFQLFPDQFDYSSGTVDSSLPAFNQTLQTGLDWIRRHGEAGQIFGKPVSLTGFGLVTKDNAPYFVPFNNTVAPYAPDQESQPTVPEQSYGVTDEERDEAYRQWIQGDFT